MHCGLHVYELFQYIRVVSLVGATADPWQRIHGVWRHRAWREHVSGRIASFRQRVLGIMLHVIDWWDPPVLVSRHAGCRVHYRVAWVRHAGFGADSGKSSCICCVAAGHVKVTHSYPGIGWARHGKAAAMIHWGHQATLAGRVTIPCPIIPWWWVQKVPLFWYYGIFTDVIVIVVVVCRCCWRHRCHGMRGHIVEWGAHEGGLCGASLRGHISRASQRSYGRRAWMPAWCGLSSRYGPWSQNVHFHIFAYRFCKKQNIYLRNFLCNCHKIFLFSATGNFFAVICAPMSSLEVSTVRI